MLKCLNYVQKTSRTCWLKTLGLYISQYFFHEIFRINVALNFALNLLLEFFKLAAKLFLKNISKIPILIAKFSSTLILKISWKMIEKCKNLSVLSERVLRKDANRDMATFVHFQRFFGHKLSTFEHILSYKLQRTCNLMVQVKWCWFHSKIFKFNKVMAKNWCTCPYLGKRFLNITQPFLGQFG